MRRILRVIQRLVGPSRLGGGDERWSADGCRAADGSGELMTFEEFRREVVGVCALFGVGVGAGERAEENSVSMEFRDLRRKGAPPCLKSSRQEATGGTIARRAVSRYGLF